MDDEGVAGAALARMRLDLRPEVDVPAVDVRFVRAERGDVSGPLTRGQGHGRRRDPALAEAGELAEADRARESAHQDPVRVPGRNGDRKRSSGRLVLGDVRELEALEHDRADQRAGP